MNVYTGTIESRDDPTVLGTDPIPAKYYYDPAWYELERKAVWLRSWLNIGHLCEIPEPGSFIRREIEFANASVLIVRGKDGVVRAFHNTCTHRGTQLTDEPCGKRNTFSCPYHMWTYGTDGSLISAPDFERFHTTKEANSLKQVAVDVCAGLIFVCFNPQESLSEYLGDMVRMLEQVPLARATHYHQYEYEIEANWKMTYDNFQENYHLRFIHPRTAGRGGLWEENPFGYPSHFALKGIHRTQTIWSNPVPDMDSILTTMFLRGMPRLVRDGLMQLPLNKEYLALFPNLFLLCNPGQHFLHTVYPLGPEKSRGVIRLYWVGADETASTRFFREMAMATARDVHSEDVDIIRAGQRGISSGALDHVHFQEKEILCRHLISVVVDKVAAYKAEVGNGL
jgi:phenylpropionate dioxygenase-like ring-hydroxylating dioxygenase large terminal subunit